jgi:hypothetical protein
MTRITRCENIVRATSHRADERSQRLARQREPQIGPQRDWGPGTLSPTGQIVGTNCCWLTLCHLKCNKTQIQRASQI